MGTYKVRNAGADQGHLDHTTQKLQCPAGSTIDIGAQLCNMFLRQHSDWTRKGMVR